MSCNLWKASSVSNFPSTCSYRKNLVGVVDLKWSVQPNPLFTQTASDINKNITPTHSLTLNPFLSAYTYSHALPVLTPFSLFGDRCKYDVLHFEPTIVRKQMFSDKAKVYIKNWMCFWRALSLNMSIKGTCVRYFDVIYGNNNRQINLSSV